VRWQWREYGDAGVLVHLDDPDYEVRWAAAQGLGRALRESHTPGLVDVLATYEDVFATFDPLRTDTAEIVAAIELLTTSAYAAPSGRTFEIPVVYGDDHGPDLAAVAEDLSVPAQRVVEIHTSSAWVVRFRASPVGAPYLDGPHFPAPVKRLAAPRARVLRNSVAISGQQTTIYPAPSPGGWRIIGRTPLRIFDPAADPPVIHRSGDRFIFRSIGAADWARYEQDDVTRHEVGDTGEVPPR
jgi:KipI family sensor histidine kinase inhibitor